MQGVGFSWNKDLFAGSASAFPGEHSSWARASVDKLLSFEKGMRESIRCTCCTDGGGHTPWTFVKNLSFDR